MSDTAPAPEPPARESASARRIGAAAILLAASALLSRILGYARDAVLAHQVGVGPDADAYFAAFTIPDWLNYLLAGSALSIAFLPRYTRHREQGDEEAADRFFGTVLGTLGGATVALTIVLWIFAGPLVDLLFGGFDENTRTLTVHLTRIVLPAQIFFLTGGIIKATLFARGRFGAAALAPLIYNACIIAGGIALGPWLGVEGFAWGVLAGALLGPFLAPFADAHGRVRYRLRFAPTDRAFVGYFVLALPLMVGQSLLTVDEWYEKIFGSHLDSGSVAWLSYARKLMLAPVAIVGQAVATAALPALTALHAQGKRDELNRVLLTTLRSSLALAVLGGAALWTVAHPMVVVLYQRGAFTPADSLAVGAILAVLAAAVPAWILQQVATRAFYARSDTWRPMALSTVIVVAAVPLYWWMGRTWGAVGLAWAGVVGMTFNAVATIGLGRALHGGPALRPLAATIARTGLIAALATAAAWHGMRPLPSAIGPMSSMAHLAVGLSVFSAVSLAGVFTIGDEETRTIVSRLSSKITGRLFRRRG